MLSNGQAVVTGHLSIAGKSRVERIIGYLDQSPGRITIQGKHTIDMTDYDMKPPSAMMGVIKVYDTVDIDFNLILQ